ncbi:Transcriptional regulator WAR1 [Golovinomyces cichoracearum]|uniref:Transcriptional regulator WAR1 n=1 Tax=Golovinomyces cichoracearum TaxID=62708 RepID=A0A420ID92_9PEZI|nr:Transcriptional regulator WAR1 [Golovinomyces cichoracearum]
MMYESWWATGTLTKSGPTLTASTRSVIATMSNSDASIDPLLRSIASATSTFRPDSKSGADTSSPFPRNFNYDNSLTYLPQQNLQDFAGTSPEDFHDEVSPNELKRSRACEACRGLKVRCEPDFKNPDNQCKRCAKANRTCITTAPSRKRRKKTDSRVAELEKKIDALTASLTAQKSSGINLPRKTNNEDTTKSLRSSSLSRLGLFQQTSEKLSSQFSACSENQGEEWATSPKNDFDLKPGTSNQSKVAANHKRRHTQIQTSQAKSPGLVSAFATTKISRSCGSLPEASTGPNRFHEYVDVIDRGFLTLEIASNIFNCYVEKMASHMPVVVFAPGTTSSAVRKSSPILFLAILSASCSMNYPHLQKTLTDEIMSIYADSVFFSGLKTMELVQALQVSSLWYLPPLNIEEFKLFQLVHIAVIMAIDIGMGRNNKLSKPRVVSKSRDQMRYKTTYPDSETIEARRTWLGCYWLCCSSSIILRRPNLIRWTPFIADCVDLLENSPLALPSDKILCQWVKSQHIAEEIGMQFSMDDPIASVNFADSQVQYSIKGFERDLEKWRVEAKPETMTPLLKMTEHFIYLYMHEVAMHVDHNIDEFKPLFTEDTLQAFAEDGDPNPLSSSCIHSLSICLTSIDGILEIFLNMEIEIIRALPISNFGRVAYAVILLLKMYSAAATENSELGKVIDKDNMKVQQYLDSLIKKLQAASADEKSQPSARLLKALCFIRNIFNCQREKNQREDLSQDGIYPRQVKSPLREETKEYSNERMTHMRPSVFYRKQLEYTPANTPLQLLSEVATGNTGNDSALSSTSNYAGSTANWQQSPQVSYSGYDDELNPVGQTHGSQVNLNNENIDPSLSMNLDYTSGDRLEQITNFASGIGDFGSFLGDDIFYGGLMNYFVPTRMAFEGL